MTWLPYQLAKISLVYIVLPVGNQRKGSLRSGKCSTVATAWRMSSVLGLESREYGCAEGQWSYNLTRIYSLFLGGFTKITINAIKIEISKVPETSL